MSIKFSRKGDVIHAPSGTVIGHWRKEDDPQYVAGRFRVWLNDQDPEDGKTCYPLYMGGGHFRNAIEEIEERSNDSPEP